MSHATATDGASTAALPCSARYYELSRLGRDELEKVMLRGETPDLDSLAGWEFRGMNHPAWARALGIQKFIKGFFRKGGEVHGYNCPVVQDGVERPWIAKPDDDAPKRFGFYRVAPVDPTARDNAYLHAVLLDYGRGGNRRLDPTRGLRDYLVRVDPGNDDLFLGKAYYAVGPLRVATSFFFLERHRAGLTDIAHR
jgi:hypothetical protein